VTKVLVASSSWRITEIAARPESPPELGDGPPEEASDPVQAINLLMRGSNPRTPRLMPAVGPLLLRHGGVRSGSSPSAPTSGPNTGERERPGDGESRTGSETGGGRQADRPGSGELGESAERLVS
jgi:hypothetical protein